MLLSFVIPCYGSEKTIEYVVDGIISKVSERENFDYEIVTVNDASPDNVIAVLKRLASDNSKIKVIDLAKNFGKHSALMAGFSVVKGDIVISLDDDGQCPTDKLWEMVDPLLAEDYDITLAAYHKKKQSAFKNFGSSVNSFMSRILLDKPKDLQFANYYAIKRFIIDEIVRYRNPYPYMEGLLLRSSRRIKNVFMDENERADDGKGYFNLKKSLSLWLNGFTAFSVKPLRIASLIGTVSALAGFVYGLVIIIRKLFFDNIALLGYSSILAVILFIGGLLMLMLGLIGEYIGRIYISINNSPQYVIRESFNCGEKDDK
ncbi:MAG: glycosyltransferase [Ruminococcus sp.]|nr:glycosyltransferase [Ruminococcus sp.]